MEMLLRFARTYFSKYLHTQILHFKQYGLLTNHHTRIPISHIPISYTCSQSCQPQCPPFLCLSRCYQPFNDGIISNHWPEEFHYQSWRRYFLLSLKSCGISQLYQEDRKLFTEQRNKRWHGRFENKLYTSWTKKAQNVRWQYKWKFN